MPIFDGNMKYFYRAKISLSETPISLWEIPNLPIWLLEDITCMAVTFENSESENQPASNDPKIPPTSRLLT